MQRNEVYGVLQRIGATHLYHASTVTTCSTFLEQGGLLSRAYVEQHHLDQTAQQSDQIDKQYQIWDRIFLDHVDIHDRGGKKKGPNHYGPVLFQFDAKILLTLPNDADIRVTKKNPVNWKSDEPESDRWFRDAAELADNIRYGNFDKMLVIRTPRGIINFPDKVARIILDDPERNLSNGKSAYCYAEQRLKRAAQIGQVKLTVNPRCCQDGCICIQKYAHPFRNIDFQFT